MTAIHIFKTERYTLFIEAPTREEARRMTPMLASYPDQTGRRSVPINTSLSNDDVRDILGSPDTYDVIAEWYGVTPTAVSLIKNRKRRADVYFAGEIIKNQRKPGLKRKNFDCDEPMV